MLPTIPLVNLIRPIKRLYAQKVTPHGTAKARADERRKEKYAEAAEKTDLSFLDNPWLQGVRASTPLGPAGYVYLTNSATRDAIAANGDADVKEYARQEQRKEDKEMAKAAVVTALSPAIAESAILNPITTLSGLAIGAGASVLGNEADKVLSDTDSEVARFIGDNNVVSNTAGLVGFGLGSGMARAAMPTVKIGNIDINPEEAVRLAKDLGWKVGNFPVIKAWKTINKFNNRVLPTDVVVRKKVPYSSIYDIDQTPLFGAYRTMLRLRPDRRTAVDQAMSRVQRPENWESHLRRNVSRKYPDYAVMPIKHDNGLTSYAIVDTKSVSPNGLPLIIQDGFSNEYRALRYLDRYGVTNTYWRAYGMAGFNGDKLKDNDPKLVEQFNNMLEEEMRLASEARRTGSPRLQEAAEQQRLARIKFQHDHLTFNEHKNIRDEFMRDRYYDLTQLANHQYNSGFMPEVQPATNFYTGNYDDVTWLHNYMYEEPIVDVGKIDLLMDRVAKEGKKYVDVSSELSKKYGLGERFNKYWNIYRAAQKKLLQQKPMTITDIDEFGPLNPKFIGAGVEHEVIPDPVNPEYVLKLQRSWVPGSIFNGSRPVPETLRFKTPQEAEAFAQEKVRITNMYPFQLPISYAGIVQDKFTKMYYPVFRQPRFYKELDIIDPTTNIKHTRFNTNIGHVGHRLFDITGPLDDSHMGNSAWVLTPEKITKFDKRAPIEYQDIFGSDLTLNSPEWKAFIDGLMPMNPQKPLPIVPAGGSSSKSMPNPFINIKDLMKQFGLSTPIIKSLHKPEKTPWWVDNHSSEE